MNKRKRSRRPLTLKLLSYAENAKKAIKHWPRYEGGWGALSVQLSNALSSAVQNNTWDSSTLDNWEWDDYHAHFTFDVTSVFRMPEGDKFRGVRVSSRFHFDPRENLVEELDRVSAEIKAYSDELLKMHQAYHKEHDEDAADA